MFCSWTDFYLFFVYKEKHNGVQTQKAVTSEEKNISLIKKNLVIHNNTATIIVQIFMGIPYCFEQVALKT